jgi:methylenetetrahydrofolate reductase (NADPH)
VIIDPLFDECQRQAQSADRGADYFNELAAKQLAIFRGLGFAGGYLGGVHSMDDVQAILDVESTFAADDWREFAREIQYPVDGEFYYYGQDPRTALADASTREGAYDASLRDRRATHNVTLAYRFSRLVHDLVFTPGRRLYRLLRSIYARSASPAQGPMALRIVERASKAIMFDCKDCGDCSLPDIAFLCPESQCAKNQRNGPCGGTRDGVCEVEDFECIWSRAYDRLKFEGREQHLLDHAPVIQDESLRGTSSWANAVLARDHSARRCPPIPPAAPPGACASANETERESEIPFDGNYPAHSTQVGVISSESAAV